MNTELKKIKDKILNDVLKEYEKGEDWSNTTLIPHVINLSVYHLTKGKMVSEKYLAFINTYGSFYVINSKEREGEVRVFGGEDEELVLVLEKQEFKYEVKEVKE